MAKDLEELVLSISADNRQILRALKKLEGDTNATTRKVERQFDQMAKKIDGRLAGIGRNAFRGLLSGAAAAVGVRELIRLADTWTDLKSRIDLAAGSMENGEVVMGRLSEMARRTYSGLEQTAESWLSNATALRELGYSTSEQLDLVETLNNALVISAAKGQRAASVMDAWSKAMALGKLSGQNLNTIIQSGGRLAEALAASMGVSTNELRALGQQGKITTREMYGVTSQLEKLREEADSMQATVSDAMQLLRDAMLQYVGGADQASQMSAKLAESIIIVADNFGEVADVALQLATVLAGALTGRALAGMISTLPKTGAAVAALVAGMRAGTLTAMGFAAALGPIGLAIGGLSAALYVYANHQSEVEYQTERATKAAELNAKALDIGRDASGRYTQALRDQIAMQVEVTRAAYTMADAAFESAARTAAAFAAITGLRFAPLDFNMQSKRNEVEALNLALAKLEDQLATIDRAGVSEPVRSSIPTTGAKSGRTTKERADEYERLAERIRESTAALVHETEVQRQLNPLVDDYGYAVEKARLEMDLLNAAKKAGKEITPELRAEIALLADQYAMAGVEAAKLAEEQDRVRQSAEEMKALAKDVLGGFVNDLREGKSAADALANALDRIADKLLDIAMNSLIEGMFARILGGFSGGGFVGGFRANHSGNAGARWSRGGYTGPGGKYEPAGTVHKGEYVFSKEATQRAGVGNLEAMHRSLKGYASGGPVAMPAIPSMPKMAGSGSSAVFSVTFSPVVDARGASVEAVAALDMSLRKMDAQFSGRVIGTVKRAINRRML